MTRNRVVKTSPGCAVTKDLSRRSLKGTKQGGVYARRCVENITTLTRRKFVETVESDTKALKTVEVMYKGETSSLSH